MHMYLAISELSAILAIVPSWALVTHFYLEGKLVDLVLICKEMKVRQGWISQ